MATSAIRGVHLVSTGTWAASTGTTRVTRSDLEAMLAASQDPGVDAAPIRLGHTDPRFDGEPAAGWVVPTGIVEDNGVATLVGDLVGMPSRLAEIAPTAYRRRSVEIAWAARTAAGKSYAAVLTGLALLGVTSPAVKGLADVMALFRAEHPLAGERTDVQLVEGVQDPRKVAQLASAAALPGWTAEDVDQFATWLGAADTASIPPPEIEAADDDPESTPPDPGGTMPVTEDRVRDLLHLEADADVEAELTRIAATRAAADPPADEPAPADPPPAGDSPESPPADPAADPTPETVTLSSGTWAQVQAQAAAGAAAAEVLAGQRREAALTAALREGRIAPAERTAFAALMERDEQGATSLLAGLTPRFGVSELGSDAAPNAAGDEAWSAWENRTFTGLAAS